MRHFSVPLALMAIALAGPASAGDPPQTNDQAHPQVTSSDGKILGRIESVLPGRDGHPAWVIVSAGSRLIYVPFGLITASPKGPVTSLTRKEFLKLD